MQVGGGLTIVLVGGGIWMLWRREKMKARKVETVA